MARRDRGALVTRALFGAGLLLLGVVGAVLLLRSPAPKKQATTAAAPPAATTPPPATTTAPPPQPVQIAAGINLIAQNPCGGTNAQVDALAGRALSAGIAGDAEAQNPALIGWFFPDEADSHHLTGRTLPAVPESSVVGRISLLTLSNH